MTEVSVVADADTLARTVAEQLLDRLRSIQAAGRVPSIALTGGTIAVKIYRALAQLDSEAVDWTQVDFWWGDERYVAADSSDRNDRGVELDLLDVVGADPERVHAMPAADESHADVATAASAYAQELRTHGGGQFDLVLLGLGPDGHVASLFPGFPQLDAHAIAVPVDRLAQAPTRTDHPHLHRPQPHPRGLVRGLRRGQGRSSRPIPRRRRLGPPDPRPRHHLREPHLVARRTRRRFALAPPTGQLRAAAGRRAGTCARL